jgi:hypothetical protein
MISSKNTKRCENPKCVFPFLLNKHTNDEIMGTINKQEFLCVLTVNFCRKKKHFFTCQMAYCD